MEQNTVSVLTTILFLFSEFVLTLLSILSSSFWAYFLIGVFYVHIFYELREKYNWTSFKNWIDKYL